MKHETKIRKKIPARTEDRVALLWHWFHFVSTP